MLDEIPPLGMALALPEGAKLYGTIFVDDPAHVGFVARQFPGRVTGAKCEAPGSPYGHSVSKGTVNVIARRPR